MGSHFVKTGLGNDASSAQYFDTPQQAFSQANQNLQASGGGVPNFLAQQTPATITPGDPSNPESAPSIQGGILAPTFLSQPTNLPKIQTPSFLEAQNNPQLAQKSETKMGKLFQILSGTLEGGAAGYGAPTVGQGFARAQHADLQRKQQFNTQQQQQIENQRQAQEDRVRQQMADQQGQLYNSEITKNAALTGESNARTSNKDLSPQQATELKKAEAQAAGFKQGSPEYNEYVYGIKPTKDSTPNAYGDFRSGYPDTPQGKQQAARDWNAQIHKGSGSRAASHADDVAEAEDIAGGFMDRAGGDVNKAMDLFTRAGASVKDKRQLSLAPKIRAAIRGSRRVQNADPLAGLLNNNSPQ